MKKLIKNFISILLLIFVFQSSLFSQNIDPEHQLMWRISSPDLENDSYIYGTMHLNDERVFNFSDSVYAKIEACKYFSLEVHPDTMTKVLLVDPFNTSLNKSFEEALFDEDSEDFIEFQKELEDKTGMDFSGFSKENLELVPLLLDKLFKKGKDRNTFLDAHLYHIAKQLKKDIVGLETLEDQRLNLSRFSKEGKINLPDMISMRKERKLIFQDMIETYSKGRVQELFDKGGFKYDTILARRNHGMVESALEYINDGGIFMAVGAAHLKGEEGMLKLFENEGFLVEPVSAVFSGNLLLKELASKELEWIREEYPQEGFSVLLPDKAYNYRPESVGGIVTFRSYPDLGLGKFFFYSAFPIMVEDFSLSMVEKELRQNLSKSGFKLKKKHVKYSKYKGYPILDVSFTSLGREIKYRYIQNGNYVYNFTITPIKEGKLEKSIVDRYFNSIDFFEVKKNSNNLFTDKKGAFSLSTNIKPQQYNLVEEFDGIKSTFEYNNFIDIENQLIHIIIYRSTDSGYAITDVTDELDGIEDLFLGENDSLISIRKNLRYGGTELVIEFEDGTFMKGLFFVRGNRYYQVASTGSYNASNVALADSMINGFKLIDYSDYTHVTFENDEFESNMFYTPVIDTLEDSYYQSNFSKKIINYVSEDKFSGMNFIIEEFDISDYSTYENIDSCLSAFKNIYVGYSDSLLSFTSNNNAEALEFDLHLRNVNSSLDFKHKLIFDGDKLYELSLIQDTMALNEATEKLFLDGFKLKNSPKRSLLLRDSSLIKSNILTDLFNSDTSVQLTASEMLYGFQFSDKEVKMVLQDYLKVKDEYHPYQYHSNIIKFIFNNNKKEILPYLKEIYLDSLSAKQMDLVILRLLLKEKNEEEIAMFKEFVNAKKPSFEETWQLNGLFYSYYKDLDKLKPIVPELIELGTTDSTVVLASLFYDLLQNEVIEYNELEGIHRLIDSLSFKFYKLSKDENETMDLWQNRSSLNSLAGIRSFGEPSKEYEEIFNFFYLDTTSYYQIDGAEYLMRFNNKLDVSHLYTSDLTNAELAEMYELKRMFNESNILPDSMLNLEKYIIVESLDYPEQEEYFEDYTVEIKETIDEGGTHTGYIVQCDFSYDLEEPENYSILIYTVIDNKFAKSDEFIIPRSINNYTEYSYFEEEGYEKVREELRRYYKDREEN